jgi:galactokinase
VKAFAPGRVNLIGDHTDYMEGLVLPMAIDRGTTIEGQVWSRPEVRLTSEDEPGVASVPLDVLDPTAVDPPWARYVAGVVAVVRPDRGMRGTVRTTLPLGAGLSSSSAFTVALALALGLTGTPREVALACQRAEQLASGVPGGVMDQLTAAAAVEGHALLIDCHTLAVEPVPLADGVDVFVVHSGVRRALSGSAYAERRAQCEAAELALGIPLRTASPAEVERLGDTLLRRRARHVVTENERVRAFVHALRVGDMNGAGDTMVASHLSLRDDFEVSIEELDTLVDRLCATPGVLGARLTGAGFGGSVVALARAGTAIDGWRVKAAGPARVDT